MKITLTMPEKHLSNTGVQTLLNELLACVGGVTSTNVKGVWLDTDTREHVIDQNVQLTWLTRRSETDELEVRRLIDNLVATLHNAGEQEVLVELQPNTAWSSVKKAEVFFGY